MNDEAHTPRFAMAPASAVFDEHLSDAEFRVLCALILHSSQDGRCYPKQESLARRLHRARSTVADHIGHLVELRYVRRGRMKLTDDPHDRRTRNVYMVDANHGIKVVPTDIDINVGSNDVVSADMKNIPIAENRSRSSSVSADGEVFNQRERTARANETRRSLSLFNALWDAAKDVIGAEPTTEGERRYWSDFIKVLLAAGATPDEFKRRAARYIAVYERKRLTIKALANHWSQFSTEAQTDGDSTRKHAAVEAAKQAERDRIAAIKRDLYRDF